MSGLSNHLHGYRKEEYMAPNDSANLETQTNPRVKSSFALDLGYSTEQSLLTGNKKTKLILMNNWVLVRVKRLMARIRQSSLTGS